ncbi:MAG: hypothetical protein JNM18_21510 [Planctomycetaceae bacterium]|nr:hypothetical protein [Planctomycetaceae bacterium]
MLPLPPSQAWKNDTRRLIDPKNPDKSEEAIFDELVQRVVARIEKHKPQNSNETLRGFHAKIHAGVMGEFKVLDNLPDAAKFGVFAQPAVYPAFVRFSNGESDLRADTKPQPRGIAMKLVGVPGSAEQRLDEAMHAATQDFLATSHSLTSIVRNVVQFFDVLEVTTGDGDADPLQRIRLALENPVEAVRIASRLGTDVLLPRVDSMATECFSGTAAVQCDNFAIKFLIHPSTNGKDADHEKHENHPDYLRRDLGERLRSGDVRFDFSAQFYVDSEQTPIEDTSVAWSENVSPLYKLAELRIPQCDIDSPAGEKLTRLVDRLSFSPWHGLKVHEPLGNVMRARRRAYPKSAAMRASLPEPTRADGGGSLSDGGTAESLRACVQLAT